VKAIATLAAACLALMAYAFVGSASAARQQAAPGVLLDPSKLTKTAPETFSAIFDTSVGVFVVRVTRAWAPHGADRFYNLAGAGFYDGNRFFRVIPKFMAQFGIHGDPEVSAAWKDATLPPDRARVSNTRGRVTFAQGQMASSRTTQVFINFGDNSKLDLDSFAPFGEVITSMLIVERVYGEYGEGIDQGRISTGGNALLAAVLPRLSYIKTVRIDPRSPAGTRY
jgi:peptidyl-prolyl cis-trans isomerase A (cyclophilin A)